MFLDFIRRSISEVCALVFFILMVATVQLNAQTTNTTIRVMSANLNGNSQTYEPFALRIFQGLDPDIVAIQEFNYSNNTPTDFRSMLDVAFGTNFVYFRESGYSIPNGIISRYPIIASGSWNDSVQSQPNRGFAWARIDIPGTNDLYVVSVHLLSTSSSNRAAEATNLKALIQASFPDNAFTVVAGDFNTDSRAESAVTTFKTFLSDNPIPTDRESGGDPDTNIPRNKPYDYVLPSFSFRSNFFATVIGARSFTNGLVFDSAVYSSLYTLNDVQPIQAMDSANAQHLAVLKDFRISHPAENFSTNFPTIATQPLSQTVNQTSNVSFTVVAGGALPLTYQWQFNGTNIANANATNLTKINVQSADAGVYRVIVTNSFGSVTSAPVVLTINGAPIITNQPQHQAVSVGENAMFTVNATGANPLSYQWKFNGTNINGATFNNYTKTNAQVADAGNYFVVVSNSFGSVTSAVAVLTINGQATGQIIAQWNFNSLPPDGLTGTGSTTPSLGSGTASLVGGTTATFAGGDAVIDPAGSTDNSGWNTTTYPAQGSNNKTRGAQFAVSTIGKQSIVVSWSSQASNTGSKYGRLQYTTNGTDFVDFPTAFTNGTSFTGKTNNLAAISGVNNNLNFAIRFVAEFESSATGNANANYVAANTGSTYGTSGTMRYDMVTVYGSSLSTTNPPANAALLSGPFYTTSQHFQFNVLGDSGTNYVVQLSTNLTTGNWVSVVTNVSPFTFIDATATNSTQRFYRAVAK